MILFFNFFLRDEDSGEIRFLGFKGLVIIYLFSLVSSNERGSSQLGGGREERGVE